LVLRLRGGNWSSQRWAWALKFAFLPSTLNISL
jgi:hypothetical protein